MSTARSSQSSSRKPTNDNPILRLGPNHVYGKKVKPDAEGALKVVLSWQEFHPNAPSEPPERDFKKLNKLCIKERQLSGSQISNFRKSHQDLTLMTSKSSHNMNSVMLPSDKDPNFTYGHKNVFDQKAKDLMEHRFAQEWLKEREEKAREQEAEKNKEFLSSVNTKAKLDIMKKRMESQSKLKPVEEKEEFKLSRFKRVSSRVDTRRPVSSVQENHGSTSKSQQQQKDTLHHNH
ncbi:hypothetical protein FDP41_005088 [Naegleria fowleri]|uniref:Uncharacterized protein n=1 Tax=Naegleria fowleri TaxID=5763 RepID=A0A6A5BN92_NAEFO|nr:uncharacterized protein FDP41_005088 [Naegleria fowleri]KAF0975761.1 hypothetical protein FDP41_005088 [Naegleria fowleri]CAG4719062.1 unnamed protein product [Naegleria fowleri]